MLPIPPEDLRVWVGPFSNADVFTESGKETVHSIIAHCELNPDARVLEVGCGCGRIAAALGTYLSDKGRYDGADKNWNHDCRSFASILPMRYTPLGTIQPGARAPRGSSFLTRTMHSTWQFWLRC